MDVRLSVDTQQLADWTRLSITKLGRAIPYRINRTAERLQQVEFGHVRSSFIVRGAVRAEFFFGSPGRPGGAAGKITTRASRSQSVPFAELEVERTRLGGKGGPILLAGFETGEERKPRTSGAKAIAVPLVGRPARPSIRGPVPPTFQIANLRLRAYYHGAKIITSRRAKHRRGLGLVTSSGQLNLSGVQGLQWKGEQRTFLLPHTARAPLGAIFQRIGRGRDQVREIYSFVRPFRLDERLRFVSIARATAPAIFREEMHEALVDSLLHEARRGK
jgi:hypothetical protein